MNLPNLANFTLILKFSKSGSNRKNFRDCINTLPYPTSSEGMNWCYHSLPYNKILDWSKFKTLNFADDKINVGEKLKTVYGRVNNIVGKGGYQHFLLCSLCFQNPLLFGVVKSWDCVVNIMIILVQISKLYISQTTNFRLFQTERVCRRQF